VQKQGFVDVARDLKVRRCWQEKIKITSFDDD